MLKVAALILCLSVASSFGDNSKGQNWALLIAGSNEFYNYRHQADVCHAYQILHKNGIPDERIVVMMYDDIANNPENTRKGVIINKPNGKDVYQGTLKDYTKEDVTPANFLKVLQGEEMSVGSKKVINSGPNDNLFVFFSDHGAPGIIAFPDGSALHASELNKAIKNMYQQKRFKNMVLYIEACESGSMFEKLLPNNIDVYVTTAANGKESSYACYYDDDLQTYLGDLYSVNWMEDSDREDISKETLYKQFLLVKKETNESHVQEFGNLTLGRSFFVSEFQAEKSQQFAPNPIHDSPTEKTDRVKSEDVQISILYRKLEKETNDVKKQAIKQEIKSLMTIKKLTHKLMTEIVARSLHNKNIALGEILGSRKDLTNHECYVPAVDRVIEKCFSLKNEFVLRTLYMLVNLCESGVASQTIVDAVDAVCPKKVFD